MYSITHTVNSLNRSSNAPEYRITNSKINALIKKQLLIVTLISGKIRLLDQKQYDLLKKKLSKFRSLKKRNKILPVPEISTILDCSNEYVSVLVKKFNLKNTKQIINYNDWRFTSTAYFKSKDVEKLKEFKTAPVNRYLTIKNSESVIESSTM